MMFRILRCFSISSVSSFCDVTSGAIQTRIVKDEVVSEDLTSELSLNHRINQFTGRRLCDRICDQ